MTKLAQTRRARTHTLRPARRSGCPRCGERRVWRGWADNEPSCPSCGLDLDRHGWVAAVWINTWITIAVIVVWIVVAFTLLEELSDSVIVGVAVVIAVVTPVAAYPFAKTLMLRLLYRFDPPEEALDGHD